jgi:hypothetical protein
MQVLERVDGRCLEADPSAMGRSQHPGTRDLPTRTRVRRHKVVWKEWGPDFCSGVSRLPRNPKNRYHLGSIRKSSDKTRVKTEFASACRLSCPAREGRT